MSQYYISKIRAKSFKSIGDEWIEIKFEKGLNAIVGINGAGKSTLLQAICFAAAGPLSVLGVFKVNELRHLGSNELCEVELHLRPCAVSKTTKKKSKNSNDNIHVHAVINAEGNRVFRLNNRIASGKEVKTKLSRIGVHLGTSTSLILQSAVTELADSTDPLSLGAVIAECSGLQAWAKEAANAQAELEAQAKDEQRIRQKIETLKRTSTAARAEASKGEKYAQLEAQVEAETQICIAKLTGVRAAAERQKEFISDLHTRALEKEKALQKQCNELEKQKDNYYSKNFDDSSNFSEAKKKLKLERVAIEEELQVVAVQLKFYQAAATALTEAQAHENDASQHYAVALREIELLEQGLLEIEMQSSSLKAAAKAQQEVNYLKVQILEAQHEMAAAEVALQEAQHQLNQTNAEMENTKENLQQYKHFMEGEESSASSVEVQLAKLAASRAGLKFKERSLVAKQQLPSKMLPNGINLPSLGQCFCFKDPAKVASQYAAALEVLAGRRLSIAVAQSTQQAAHVLASQNARGLRIWAVDAILSVNERIQYHRQVAATFLPIGSVIVPMDLLSFDKSYEGVISKAFGSHVIVESVQIGRQVMQQYNIPSIALDGTVTSRGRLVGGWAAPEQQLRGHMHSKIRTDLAKANLDFLRDQLGELDAAVLALKKQGEAKAANAAAEEAVLKYNEAQAEVMSSENSFTKAAQNVERLEMELNSRQAVAAALNNIPHSHIGSTSSTAGDQKALLRARISEQRKVTESLKRQKADAAAEVAAAIAGCPAGGLHDKDGGSTEVQAAHAGLQERLNELDHQLLLLDNQIREQQKERRDASREEEARYQRDAAAAAEALDAAAMEKAMLGKQLDFLENSLKEMEILAAGVRLLDNRERTTTVPYNIPLDFFKVQSMVEDVHAAAAKHASLLAELTACKSLASGSSSMDAVANYRAAEIAERELALLLPHADTMHQIALNLAEGIELMNPHAEKFNECVFDTVARFFKDLTAQLLPGIELRVTRIKHGDDNDHENQSGATIHRNGAQFSYRRHGADMNDWVIGLEALSGGQRTLISLAYLVAAKAVGGAALSFSSSVLLADEVDAALDQANQEQAARLLSMLCTKKDESSSEKPPLAQVICISHSPIFQQLCDKVIKLTRNSENGTTMLAPNSL